MRNDNTQHKDTHARECMGFTDFNQNTTDFCFAGRAATLSLAHNVIAQRTDTINRNINHITSL